ncbi:alanine/glycine:cation symporter family protein [Schwartzia succinivorans]|jgi:AGCS family alanine or glycine:cation symporter|uniref:Alanine or glycine:cation symporter, AGCS family n=1 Tax=Schwartzia succinivorans DSM 10502 TaxID=1123243 RepID=A0A1M4SZX6_9FIRM|nr:sodium:alanine symporter family protein [Schwartzia succinivorans]SHE37670.1 alanine or glycine:cation symporter, AGCS family [Schwartzia succinivorans DSM 10502]
MVLFNSIVSDINNFLWTYVIIVVLIACGIGFTLRTRFVQLTMLPEMLRLLVKDGRSKRVHGTVSSFQAFCVSTASRVGVGNIAGVAIAIVTGGPGAIFWMWLIAFIGSATGFIESTLAQIYKLPRGKNRFHGGPAYYIQNRLHQPAVAKLFAVLISITFGLIYVSVQANTIALSLETAFTVPPLLTAAVIAILTAVSISGGMVRIARITAYFVPIMAGLYLLTAFAVILMNLDKVPGMFALIIHDAFTPQAAVGGGIGTTILTGIRRGLFSNEAGEGSVPNAAATANVSHPVKQGLVQAFGVYVDTWIVCTATAFIVLLSGQYTIGGELTGIALTQKSLESIFGGLAPGAVALMILLFAFSSVIGNYYYGEINIAFFETKSRLPLTLYRVFVVVMAAFGCVAELPLVWNLADLFMGFLALTNLYAIARLAKYACAALDDYITKKKSGITEPDFSSNTLGDSDGIHAWNSK